MPFFRHVYDNNGGGIRLTGGNSILNNNCTHISNISDDDCQLNGSTTDVVNVPPSSTTRHERRFNIIRKPAFKVKRPPKRRFHRRQITYNNRWDEEDDENLKEEPIPASIRIINIKIEPSNVVCIEDSSSIYSSVYSVKKLKYNDIYFRSVDEGFQYYKLLDLCNRPFTFPCNSRTSNQRRYVKRCLAEHNKTRVDVVRWRQEKGLNILFELTVQKFIQNPDLCKIMKDDKDKLILHVHGEDNYDACGNIENLQTWLQTKINEIIQIPITTNFSKLQIFPTISTGKNIQGVIVMLARQYLEEEGWF
uniref:NADAR domain-containing protein n=1 Tax=Strongyloides venezuelensis TaxID=75913 RepID=A0A0K0FVZ1_STRVS